MIFYGTKGTHLATEPVFGQKCPHCGQSNSLAASVYGRYAHIYWIPFFPYSKIGLLSCESCQHVWEEKALPPALAPAVQELKKNSPHRRWEWSGLALALLLVAFGIAASARDTRTDDTYLDAPRAGDIYTVRSDSSRQYSLLKVRQVSGNSVELVANEYETDSSTPITSLNEPSKYRTEPFVLTRLDLQIMRKKGQLTDVDRP